MPSHFQWHGRALDHQFAKSDCGRALTPCAKRPITEKWAKMAMCETGHLGHLAAKRI
jgi:hypothetical protein